VLPAKEQLAKPLHRYFYFPVHHCEPITAVKSLKLNGFLAAIFAGRGRAVRNASM
jgi:hypothetical protein